MSYLSLTQVNFRGKNSSITLDRFVWKINWWYIIKSGDIVTSCCQNVNYFLVIVVLSICIIKQKMLLAYVQVSGRYAIQRINLLACIEFTVFEMVKQCLYFYHLKELLLHLTSWSTQIGFVVPLCVYSNFTFGRWNRSQNHNLLLNLDTSHCACRRHRFHSVALVHIFIRNVCKWGNYIK